MPFITIRGADQVATTREFEDELLIGRGAECGWSVRHPLVSKRHLHIRKSAEGWSATDLGSTNGTWLADRRITSHLLADGDVITIGELELIYTVDPDPRLAQPADAARKEDSATSLKSSAKVNSIRNDEADQDRAISSPIPAPGGAEAVAIAPAERLVGPLFEKSWESLLASPQPALSPQVNPAARPWDEWKQKLLGMQPKDRKLLALAASLVIVAILSLYWGLGESEHRINPPAGGASQTPVSSPANPASVADVPV